MAVRSWWWWFDYGSWMLGWCGAGFLVLRSPSVGVSGYDSGAKVVCCGVVWMFVSDVSNNVDWRGKVELG